MYKNIGFIVLAIIVNAKLYSMEQALESSKVITDQSTIIASINLSFPKKPLDFDLPDVKYKSLSRPQSLLEEVASYYAKEIALGKQQLLAIKSKIPASQDTQHICLADIDIGDDLEETGEPKLFVP